MMPGDLIIFNDDRYPIIVAATSDKTTVSSRRPKLNEVFTVISTDGRDEEDGIGELGDKDDYLVCLVLDGMCRLWYGWHATMMKVG